MQMLKLPRVAAMIFLAASLPVAVLDAQDTLGGGVASRAARARPQPGDRIFVNVLREPTLNDTTIVNERGEAAIAKIGIMNVSQFTIAELQDTLRVMYGEYLRNPALEVLVLRRVVVNGEVNRPDVYLVDVSSTVADVIARAGGFRDSANRDKVIMVRDGVERRISRWDTQDAMTSELQSGDQIVVGRKSWWVMNSLSILSTAAVVTSVGIAVFRR
jgi:polysaccharide export outer membrane protein